MASPRCPICETPLPREADPRWRPFCSERCKLVDLGRWLDGVYAIPGPPADVPEPGSDEPR